MTPRVVIDTQALIWFAENADELSARAVSIVDDPATTRLASAASVWEMAIKISIGKLILKTGTLTEFVSKLRANEIDILPVLAEDAIRVGELPVERHKDPFDRLIAAQCLRQGLTLLSIDRAFDDYGVHRVW